MCALSMPCTHHHQRRHVCGIAIAPAPVGVLPRGQGGSHVRQRVGEARGVQREAFEAIGRRGCTRPLLHLPLLALALALRA